MADFNLSIDPDSAIYYLNDNNNAFLVQWSNIFLQDASKHNQSDAIDKPFSIQAILKSNGDIIFAYEKVPYNISMINGYNHPVKAGISDAYVIDRFVFSVRRKTMYIYHQIELEKEKISNGTVIYFKVMNNFFKFRNFFSNQIS